MSEAAVSVSTSVGPSAGAVASAAGRIEAGGAIGMGAKGIGFENGSPSFSGLGRSDGSFASFSTNEGPKGPVSFNNSQDLFAETKAVTPSLSRTERPVSGNIFSETEVIAQAQPSAAKEVSIFENLSEYSVVEPVNEGPRSFSITDTEVVAKASSTEPEIAISSSDVEAVVAEPEFEAVIESSQVEVESVSVGLGEPEAESREEVIASVAEFSGKEIEEAAGVVEEIADEKPMAYEELKADLASAAKVQELVSEVVEDEELAASISQSAMSTVMEKAEIEQAVEARTETQAQVESETASETQAISVQTRNGDADVHRDSEVQRVPKEPSYVWDDEANAAREEDAELALRRVIEAEPEELDAQSLEEIVEIDSSGNVKIKAKAIANRMNMAPSDDERSKLAKEEGVTGDGSYDEMRRALEASPSFENEEQAKSAIKQAIEKNPGVERGQAGKYATELDRVKVLRGQKPNDRRMLQSA